MPASDELINVYLNLNHLLPHISILFDAYLVLVHLELWCVVILVRDFHSYKGSTWIEVFSYILHYALRKYIFSDVLSQFLPIIDQKINFLAIAATIF